MNAASSGNIKKRYNGWKTLFLESNIQECGIFLTTSQDGGDLLLEAYEKNTNLPAPLVTELELPGLIGWNSVEAFQSVNTYCEGNKELLTQIHEALAALLQSETFNEEQTKNAYGFEAISKEWKIQLETVFPAKQFGRVPVKCYLFPGFTCSALIGKTKTEIAMPKNGLLVVVD